MNINQLVLESSTPPGLVDLKQYGFKLDLSEVKFFNPKNPKILLNRKATNALVQARKMLPPGYNFIISSGYRGYEEQVRINKFMKKKLKKMYPNNWEEQLNIFTGGEDYLEYLRTHKGKFVYMSHASGNAVDIIGIVNDRNKSLDMGGQTNTIKDKLDYYEKSNNIIRDNRRLLKEVLIKNGFDNYDKEWWHWGYYKG